MTKAKRKSSVTSNRGRSRPAPSLRAEKSAARREAILLAALDEFSARGFAAARLDDVARRAGVAKGTIYLHFHDKEALFQEIVRSLMGPFVGTLEGVFRADVPLRTIADQVVNLFVHEVFETRRRDVIRLIITEGPRFPKLAEFYYREVLSRIFAGVRVLARRALERGEISHEALIRFPQLIAAPGLVAIIWIGLFDRFEPLNVREMLQAHLNILFDKGKLA